MAAKVGRLPSGGAISVSQINTQAGRPATAATNLGDNHMRAFQGNRAANTPTSLGDARGRAVTFGKWIKRSGIGSGVNIPTFGLSAYFHPSQMAEGYPLYITSEITDDWWGALNEPRNITITSIGTNRNVTHGGTGGRKNYYCETKYYNNKSLYLRGWYSGKSSKGKQGRVNVGHLSLLDAGYGKLS
jgi:hypothetical protein